MASETLDSRVTHVIQELNKKGDWAYKNMRTLTLLEKDIRLNVKRFIDDPTNYKINITSSKVKLLTSKLKNKLLLVVDSENILKKLHEYTVVDTEVFNKTLLPYLTTYFPYAESLLKIIASLTYVSVALEIQEEQDGDSCILGAAILSAVKES